MKKSLLATLVVATICGAFPSVGWADTYHEYKACLRNCIATTDPWTWARAKCGADCTAAWVDQKVSINININIGSTGHNIKNGIANLLVQPGQSVTVVFDIETEDVLNSVELILVDDANNPADPAFGTVVGTDNNGGDGWSVTFDSTPYGNFSGFLLARAQFQGHDEEIDGDQAVIIIGTESIPIPTVSEWGMIVMLLGLLSAGTIIMGFRRRVVMADGTTTVDTSRSTFVATVFTRVLVITLAATVAGLAGAMFIFGPLKAVDIGGAFVSALALAYLIHLWVLLKRE